MYKGLKVAVYKTDKTEISLTRQDLIELINVCSLSLRIIVAVNTIRVVDLDWEVVFTAVYIKYMIFDKNHPILYLNASSY